MPTALIDPSSESGQSLARRLPDSWLIILSLQRVLDTAVSHYIIHWPLILYLCTILCRFIKHDVRRRVLADKLRFSKLRCTWGHLRTVRLPFFAIIRIEWHRTSCKLCEYKRLNISHIMLLIQLQVCFYFYLFSGYMLVQKSISGAAASFSTPCCVGRFPSMTTTCQHSLRRSAMGSFSPRSTWTLPL